MDAILYILATGCQWRALPKDFPPFTTVQHYFYDWRDRNVWRKINRILVERARRAAGRKPTPSAKSRHRAIELNDLTGCGSVDPRADAAILVAERERVATE